MNIKAFLVLLDYIIKQKELSILNPPSEEEGESVSERTARLAYHYIFQIPQHKQELFLYQTLKNNIARLFPKLDLRKIILFTIAEITASASGDQSLLTLIEGLKVAID